MSYNPYFFTVILDSMLRIYNALSGFSNYVFRFLSLTVYDVLKVWSGNLPWLPDGSDLPDWIPNPTMLEFLFGASISVLFIGIVWKWFKEFIL